MYLVEGLCEGGGVQEVWVLWCVYLFVDSGVLWKSVIEF